MRLFLSIILSAFVLTACHVSPENTYYTLSVNDTPPLHLKNKGFVLGKVTIPDILDRPQIVMKSGANEIHILEYSRWAEPFEDMVYHTLGDDLATQQAGSHSRTGHVTGGHEVRVTIDQFIASDDGRVTLKASWTVANKTSAANAQKSYSHFTFEQTAEADKGNVTSAVASMSGLLNDLATAIIN